MSSVSGRHIPKIAILTVYLLFFAATGCEDDDSRLNHNQYRADVSTDDTSVPVDDTEVDDTGTDVDDTGTEVDDTGTEVDDTGTEVDDTGTEVDDAGTEVDVTSDDADGGDDDADIEETNDTSPSADECDDVPPLEEWAGWSHEVNDIIWDADPDPTVYEEVFGTPFPGTTNTRQLYLSNGRYASIEFETPAMDSNAHVNWGFEEPMGGFPGGTAFRWVSISSCPGIFDPDHLEEDCIKRFFHGSFQAVGPGHDDAHRRCELASNKTYYFNLLYSDGDIGEIPPEPWDCESPGCGNVVTPTFTGF